jgi:hypothetical protein
MTDDIVEQARRVFDGGERVISYYKFRCLVCGAEFTHDHPAEPCCTGPTCSDDHPMEIMRLVRIEKHDVGPQYAERRAAGMMLQPGGDLTNKELIIARK